MNNNIIFNQYLSNQLSGKALQAFEANIKNDEAFRKEFEMHVLIVEALKEEKIESEAKAFVDNLSQQFHQKQSQYFKQYVRGQLSSDEKRSFELRLTEDDVFAHDFKKFKDEQIPLGKIKKLRPVWAMATAAAIGLIVFVVFSLNQTSPYEKFDAIAMGFYPKVEHLGVSSLSTQVISNKEQIAAGGIEALEAYKNKNWQTAETLLSAYLKPKPQGDLNILLNLYLGRTRLELEDYEGAARCLPEVEAVVDEAEFGMLKDIAKWHLALAKIALDDKKEAKDIFEKLKQSKNRKVREKATIAFELINKNDK